MLQRCETLTGGSIVDYLLAEARVYKLQNNQGTEVSADGKFALVVETAINDLLAEARKRGFRTLNAASEQPVHNIMLTEDWAEQKQPDCDCPLCNLMRDYT